MSNELASAAMWIDAVSDVDAEDHRRSLVAAKVALSGTWPFLAAATSEEEFEHRLVLVAHQIEAQTPAVVLDEVVAGLRTDFGAMVAEQAAQARQAALTVTASAELPRPEAYVHVQARDGYWQVDRVEGATITTLGRTEDLGQARTAAASQNLAMYENGSFSGFPPVREVQEFYDASSGRWVAHADRFRVRATYTPDPLKDWRYHYPEPEFSPYGGSPPAPSGGAVTVGPEGNALGPDGFPIDLGVGEQRTPEAYARQTTPGAWTVTPGTEWRDSYLPNAATGLPQGQQPSGNAATGSRHTARDYAPGESIPTPFVSIWHNESKGRHQVDVVQDPGSLFTLHRSSDPDDALAVARTYADQHGVPVYRHGRHVHGVRHTAYDDPDEWSDSNWMHKQQGSSDDFYGTPGPFTKCPDCGENRARPGRPCPTCGSQETRRTGVRHTAEEGVRPQHFEAPLPNPNYFSQGNQGLAGPPTFPEDPAEFEPYTHNNMDDFYGTVPPQVSSGSQEGQVDGSGYSRMGVLVHEGDYQYVHKQGDKWVITQKGTGKVLSRHDSEDDAKQAFKAMMRNKTSAQRCTAMSAEDPNDLTRPGHRPFPYNFTDEENQAYNLGLGHHRSGNRYEPTVVPGIIDQSPEHQMYTRGWLGHPREGWGGGMPSREMERRWVRYDPNDPQNTGKHVPITSSQGPPPFSAEAIRHTAPGGGEHAPYKIKKVDGGYAVFNAKGERKNDDAKSYPEARQFQKALYKNVPGASESAEKAASWVDTSQMHANYGDPQFAPKFGPQGEESDCNCHYDAEGTCHINPLCPEHGHYAKQGIKVVSAQFHDWNERGAHPGTPSHYLRGGQDAPRDMFGNPEKDSRVEDFVAWARGRGTNPDDLRTLYSYQKEPGIGRAHTDHIADQYHLEGPEWRERAREGARRTQAGPFVGTPGKNYPLTCNICGTRFWSGTPTSEAFHQHVEGHVGDYQDRVLGNSEPPYSAEDYPHPMDRQSRRTAATNGQIVGHCDHCHAPVRWHGGKGEEGHLEHLHNSSAKCTGGGNAKTGGLSQLPQFFDARTTFHSASTELAMPPANDTPTPGGASPGVTDPATNGSPMASAPAPAAPAQAAQPAPAGSNLPQATSQAIPTISSHFVPFVPTTSTTASTVTALQTMTQPTPENPTGRNPDEYLARTWEGLVHQRPMQSSEDRAMNTPTIPRDPIKTRQINTPTPGLGQDNEDEDENDENEDEDEE
jgi:hypothetical protein